MRQIYFVLGLILFLPNLGAASAMSPEKSKCFRLENSAKSYKAWKNDMQRFLTDYDSLNEKARFDVSQSALKKVVKLTKEFAKDSGLRAPDSLITQSEQLLSDVASGYTPPRAAMKVMKSGLIRFEDRMDDMIFRAQAKNPNCEIFEYPVHTYSNGSSSGVN